MPLRWYPVTTAVYGIHRLTNFFRAPLGMGHTAVTPLLPYPTCWVGGLGISHISSRNYAAWKWTWC